MTDLFTGTAKEQEAKVDEYLAQKRAILDTALADKRLGFDDSERLFFKKMHCLNPQSYGARIQNWIKEKVGLKSVRADKERGDAKNDLHAYFEFKASYKTPDGSYNFIQIRPYHNVHGYCFVAIDPDDNYSVQYFYLTDTQAKYETYNAHNSAHGNVSDTRNKTKEYKIPLKVGTIDYARWLRTYKIPDFNTLEKILTKKPFTDERRAYYGKQYQKRDGRSIWDIVKSKVV